MGFAPKCYKIHAGGSYQNAGHIFEFVRAAVVESLTRQGFRIADGFGPDGRELPK